jgi:amidophosphoribosyltransferase
MGGELARKIADIPQAQDIDVVIPIPDSSRPSALELANNMGLKYREGFVKNRYIGRTFIMPGQAIRQKSVRQKLNPIGMEFKDKVVLLVDDSIVRGTTSREIVQMAREAGARKVYFASASPPVRYPNVYGIDMPNQRELIATGRTDAEIAHEIGAALLIYQDLEAPARGACSQSRLKESRRPFGLLRDRRRHRRLFVQLRRNAPDLGGPPNRAGDRLRPFVPRRHDRVTVRAR